MVTCGEKGTAVMCASAAVTCSICGAASHHVSARACARPFLCSRSNTSSAHLVGHLVPHHHAAPRRRRLTLLRLPRVALLHRRRRPTIIPPQQRPRPAALPAASVAPAARALLLLLLPLAGRGHQPHAQLRVPHEHLPPLLRHSPVHQRQVGRPAGTLLLLLLRCRGVLGAVGRCGREGGGGEAGREGQVAGPPQRLQARAHGGAYVRPLVRAQGASASRFCMDLLAVHGANRRSRRPRPFQSFQHTALAPNQRPHLGGAQAHVPVAAHAVELWQRRQHGRPRPPPPPTTRRGGRRDSALSVAGGPSGLAAAAGSLPPPPPPAPRQRARRRSRAADSGSAGGCGG